VTQFVRDDKAITALWEIEARLCEIRDILAAINLREREALAKGGAA
jgi:hypothetical protein